MANRHTLHIRKLEDFKEWLVKDGWEIEETKGIYEVLRARKQGRQNPLIVYTKADAKEHLSVMDRDKGVVDAFLRDCNKAKTNADRIRSMSDAEIADFILKNCDNPISEVNEDMCNFCNIYEEDKGCDSDYCKNALLKWLQSEVEE